MNASPRAMVITALSAACLCLILALVRFSTYWPYQLSRWGLCGSAVWLGWHNTGWRRGVCAVLAVIYNPIQPIAFEGLWPWVNGLSAAAFSGLTLFPATRAAITSSWAPISEAVHKWFCRPQEILEMEHEKRSADEWLASVEVKIAQIKRLPKDGFSNIDYRGQLKRLREIRAMAIAEKRRLTVQTQSAYLWFLTKWFLTMCAIVLCALAILSKVER